MNRLFIILLLVSNISFAQNKSDNVWIFGSGAKTATFSDTSRPITGLLIPSPSNIAFTRGHSNICDSATGELVFLSNGFIAYDTLGNIIDNGDHLVPNKMYYFNSYPEAPTTQGSLILPKGRNGKYYLFNIAITDTFFDYWNTNPFGDGRYPYDLLQYHVVDMNVNGGAGKVTQKNVELLSNRALSKVGMMACQHANGYDWWLLKQGAYDNTIYTFLVTADTVLLDTIQSFGTPIFGYYDLKGQSCFSNDGTKYAFGAGGLSGIGNKIFLADFDRCTGVLSKPKVFNVPVDSTGYSYTDSIGQRDSVISGLCFSPNDSFLYVAKSWNIYQFEYANPDSSQAWYTVYRYDSLASYSLFGQLQLGPDGRVYMGQLGGYGSRIHVVDKPNNKGISCQFCPYCLNFTQGNFAVSSPPNMPNFNLGAKTPCWPLSTGELRVESGEMVVFPNPVNGLLFINTESKEKRELYSSVGQLLKVSNDNVFDVSGLASGVYYLKCGQEVRKVLIE